MKKAFSLILVIILAFSLAGCNPTESFTCQELTMQVPEGMTDVSALEENAMFRFALENDELFICGIRQDFLDLQDGRDMSLHDYVHQLTEDNGMHDAIHNDRNGYVYLYFQTPLADGVHTYLCGAYKASEGFWLIQIDGLRADFDEERVFKYLDSVKFA